MSYIHIDFETKSVANLKQTGVYRYAEDASTRVLCMAWAVGPDKPRVWKPGEPFPAVLELAILAGYPIHAWNAAFERQIWRLARQCYGFPAVRDTQWRCTMVRAAYYGLPMSLDMASAVMGGPRKNADGHKLMLKMCKPRSTDPFGNPVWWDEDPTEGAMLLDMLGSYCGDDVEAERGIGRRIPALPDDELALWRLDQEINDRGVAVDHGLVSKMSALAKRGETKLNADMRTLTGGAINTCGQVDAILKWLEAEGVTLPNLRSKTVADALDDPDIEVFASDDALAVLQTRREAAKSSVKKLNALVRASGSDGRVRGMLQFYGAGRTGRWAGRIFQPQNLPRPTLKQVRECIEFIIAGGDLEGVEAFFGPVMSALSSCIRGCLVAERGMKLMSVDYAQIEARVLAWLAGQTDVLDLYASGADVYTYDANKIGSDNRQLGKVCRLGLGFGMGAARFIETALTYGLKLDTAFAEDVVRGWRQNNKKIVSYWYEIGRAVTWVLQQDTPSGMDIGAVRVFWARHVSRQKDLVIRLPSGRDLVYFNARVDPDGYGGYEISYEGMNQLTKKWESIRSWGGKFVENIVQAVARDLMKSGLENVVATPVLRADPVLTVHDEIIFEVPSDNSEGRLKSTIAVMTRLPAWAHGLPLAAEGWVGDRYRK